MDELDTHSLDPILTVSVSNQGGEIDWDYTIDTILERDELACLLSKLAARFQGDSEPPREEPVIADG
tara:strand:+ start:352 stop:552 length:201 start_codon:yes stop_codon:yes gene_type:complete